MELRQSNEIGRGFTFAESAVDAGLRAFMLGVYTKLALGLGLAGAVAWVVGNVPQVSRVCSTASPALAGLIAYDTQRLKLVYKEAAADLASLATATN